MGSYFHNWIDYNGVAFSIELLEWGHQLHGYWRLENSDRYRCRDIKNIPLEGHELTGNE